MKNNIKSKKFKIEISEDGLNIINSALESYSRLGLRQFKYSLEAIPEFFKLDYKTQLEIEKYLQSKIPGNNNMGIYHPEVKNFTKAFQIKKELEKYVALDKSGGIRENWSNIYDGCIYNEEYLPTFLDENNNKIEHKKEFNIPAKIKPKLKELAKESQWNKIWNLIDEHVKKGDIRGNKTKIAPDFSKIIVYEPYRLSGENI